MHSQVTHIASLLFFVTGLRAVAVQAFVGGDRPEADGWDALCFRIEALAVGTIASTATIASGGPTVERIELFGDRGHAGYDMGKGTLSIRRYDGGTLDDGVGSESERYPRAAPSERLVAALRGEAGVLVSGELGRLTTEFVTAALKSAETGRPVRLARGRRAHRPPRPGALHVRP
jgi:predicted dehydrogenase